MEDLEIIKRIAEIEKPSNLEYDPKGYPMIKVQSVAEYIDYDPLTDKALCFDLLIKHNIELTPEFDGSFTATVAEFYTTDELIDYEYCDNFANDKNPQRAICLAIIAKHEGK